MRSLLRPPKEDRSRRPHPSRLPQARRLRSSYEPPGLWSPIGVISYLHGKSARSRLRQRSLTVGAQPPRSGNNGLCEAPVPSKSRSTLRRPLGDSEGMTSGLARSNTTDSNMHGYRLSTSFSSDESRMAVALAGMVVARVGTSVTARQLDRTGATNCARMPAGIGVLVPTSRGGRRRCR